MDRIRNEQIRKTAQIKRFGDKVTEPKLRWFEDLRRWTVNALDKGCRQEEKNKIREECVIAKDREANDLLWCPLKRAA